MAYEALYRRYRPSRFKDAFFGQDHVVAALRNAIEGDRVGHAYLFSGPRGTGKTTSARILAKALNCTNLQGGEPCNECDSCLAFQSGGSYDLHELDAASNNGVDAMRDLIGKVALGSPGRTKVYILDEVHMLSSGAENALLKTLEEPPPHVVFVLCTTEPNKVVPTIRSRTQHLQFSLLNEAQVGELIDHVVGDAGLDISPEARQYVVRAGGGSARDTLSALDQVVAAGGAPQGGEYMEALLQALIDRDATAALAAVDGALQSGRDAAGIGTSLLHELRAVFLAAMRADLGHLPEADAAKATERAANMHPARVTRAVEVIGAALIEMRQAPEPRVDLEVALMRLTRADLDTDPAALIARIEQLERQLADGAGPPPGAGGGAASQPGAAATASSAAAPVPVRDADASAPVASAPGTTTTAAATPEPEARPATAPSSGASQERASSGSAGATGNAVPPAQADSPQPSSAGTGRSQSGAARARAELARQDATPDRDSPPAAPSTAGGPKTLADVRRERQAAALQAGESDQPHVDAAADARRDRQSAAQAAGAAMAPAPVAPPTDQPAGTPPTTEPQTGSETASAPTPEPQASSSPPPVPDVEEPSSSQPAPEPAGLPSKDELQASWPSVLDALSGHVRARFSAGHFVDTTDTARFGLPNPVHRDRCEEVRAEVDQALTAHFGRPLPLTLVVDVVEQEPDFFSTPPSGGAGAVDEAEAAAAEEASIDVHDLVDATGDVPSAQDRVMSTFENSVLVEDPTNPNPNQ